MALVVNKYINNKDINNNKYHRGLKVKITLGNNNSSTWLIRAPFDNSTKVWFGTATSIFSGYGYVLKSNFDEEGIEHITFNYLPADGVDSLLAEVSGKQSRLLAPGVSGVFGETSRAAWAEIVDECGYCDLRIEDPDGVVELISVKEVPDPQPTLYKRVIAYVPDESIDEDLAKWLLANPNLSKMRTLELQIMGDYLSSNHTMKSMFLGMPEFIEAKAHGFIILKCLSKNDDPEEYLDIFPRLGGQIKVLDLPLPRED